MKQIVYICGLISGLCVQSMLAQGVTFRAETDAEEVITNTVFSVSFVLENAEGSDFQTPTFDGLKVVSGPSMSMSTTFINGRGSSKRSYTYNLLASEPGSYTIRGATIRVGSNNIQAGPLTITVVQGKTSTSGDGTVTPGEDDVFLRAEVDTTMVFPGQQFRIDYKLYTTVNVRNYHTVSEDPYESFYFRYVKDFDNRARYVVVDGVQYRVQTMKSVALFPQKPGTYTIDPFIANVGIAVQDPRRSLFFSTRTSPRVLSSNTLEITVPGLPQPAPPEFTGAVGHYQIAVQANRNQLSTDDALDITLQIVGDGDAKRWSAPTLEYLADDFEIYDPRVVSDNSADQNAVIRNAKVINYLMIPLAPGEKEFTIDFTFFDPDSAIYRTIRSQPITLNVIPGTHRRSLAAIDAAGKQQIELAGLKSPDRMPRTKKTFLFSPLYTGLAALPFLFLIIVIFQRRRKDAFAALDPVEKKRRRAMRIALSHLEEAKAHIGGDDRTFFDAISRSIISYISGKLNISTSELTKDNLAAAMERAGVSQVHREEAMEIVQQGEVVLYAGVRGEADHREVYEQVLRLITEMEI